jgi:epoxyqueuosine reductase QueG
VIFSIPNSNISISTKIKDYASQELGIDLIGICTAEPLLEARKNLEEFLQLGYQGEMNYLQEAEKRTNPNSLLSVSKKVKMFSLCLMEMLFVR